MGGSSSCLGVKKQPTRAIAYESEYHGAEIKFCNEKTLNKPNPADSQMTISLPSTLQSRSGQEVKSRRSSNGPHQFGFFKLYPVQNQNEPSSLYTLPEQSYENLSNRMERLRHSQNHSNSTSNLRCASVQVKETKPLTRVASTALLNNNLILTNLQEESSFGIDSKYSGRVTKNTGIRKYNQRMLRDVGNINKRTPPKVEQTQFTKQISPAKYIPRTNYEVCAAKPIPTSIQRIKLEPGKIYTKEELEKYFAS